METSVIIAVTGGRYYTDSECVYRILDAYHKDKTIHEIFSGGASGADYLAEQWALERSVPVRRFDADWKTHGRAAGPIRNRMMMKAGPDLLIAFPGGFGTESCKNEAMKAGVPVYNAK